MTHLAKRIAPLLAVAVAAGGCASGAAMRAGREAERTQDYDRAVVEYTKVLRADPDNRTARQSLEAARLRAALDHYTRGRRFAADGRLDEAVVELQIAAELNPGSGDIDAALAEVRNQLRSKVAVAREGKTALEAIIDRSRALPAEDELPRDIRIPATITFAPNVSSRDVYLTLARFANVTVVFDPQFVDRPITVDVRNSSFAEALQAVSAATRNFYRVTAPRTITIIPDTPAKRREYEEEVVQVFYLSNADLKETLDLLRIVIDARRVSQVAATNAITIKDTPERVEAAGRLIRAIDKARPEVVIDVELLEIDRTRLREYGLQLASPGAAGLSGSAGVDDELTLRDVRNLTQSGVFMTNLPRLFYRLLKQDNNTRTLANPQLRTTEGMPAQAQFGERVPVPVTQFLPIAAGGINQQPITSFQYENIGVNIDITPRTHHNDQVSLALKVEISSISGTGFGGLPTFGNRSISTVIRLKDGETNMLAGLIRDNEREVLAGVPGLSDLPLVGRLFGHTRRETQETDIILTLTPHIVRVLDVSEEDLRPFRVRRDGDAAPVGIVDLPALPAPVEQPPAAPAPPAPQPQPTPGPIRVPPPPGQ